MTKWKTSPDFMTQNITVLRKADFFSIFSQTIPRKPNPTKSSLSLASPNLAASRATCDTKRHAGEPPLGTHNHGTVEGQLLCSSFPSIIAFTPSTLEPNPFAERLAGVGIDSSPWIVEFDTIALGAFGGGLDWY